MATRFVLDSDGYSDEEIEYLQRVLPEFVALLVQRTREKRQANFEALVELLLGDAEPQRISRPGAAP